MDLSEMMGWLISGAMLVGGVGLLMFIHPTYSVWNAGMKGKAVLAHAQYSREVAVAEAKAKMESASLLAQAEVIRAKGHAESNKIIGESLKNNESYLRYLWIQNLENSKEHQVIYVPTEAGLPLLEAGRLKNGNNHDK